MAKLNLFSTVKGKPQIHKKNVFCTYYPQYIENSDASFKEMLSSFDKNLLALEPSVTNGALSNAHGDWYEWVLAISVWNLRIKHGNNKLILLMPNVSTFDVSNLYVDKISSYISDLKEKAITEANVHLITSNPDFVIIDTENMDLPVMFSEPIDEITPDKLSSLENAYENFIGACEFDNIVGYLSVKTSLRPDRRLQIAHEGSLMKALYVHIQTREWIMKPKGLKYYAMSTMLGEKDRLALKTVATHSITTVLSLPEAAVDEAFSVNSVNQATDALRTLLE